jgi:predicted kinase
VHLLCGLPGSGKTTYACQLAANRGAVRFTLDEWMLRLTGLRYDEPDYVARIEPCQELIWDVARQVLGVGHDVVLDWNQWSRDRRAKWRDRARELGYEVVVHYFEVPVETAIARAQAREDDGISHQIDANGVRHLDAIFEPPVTDEGLVIHVVGSDA